jgi:hypothetical protein
MQKTLQFITQEFVRTLGMYFPLSEQWSIKYLLHSTSNSRLEGLNVLNILINFSVHTNERLLINNSFKWRKKLIELFQMSSTCVLDIHYAKQYILSLSQLFSSPELKASEIF